MTIILQVHTDLQFSFTPCVRHANETGTGSETGGRGGERGEVLCFIAAAVAVVVVVVAAVVDNCCSCEE